MCSDNMAKNTGFGKCPRIVTMSALERKLGSPNPKEVAEVLNL